MRDYVGAGRHFGEIGLMWLLSERVAQQLDPAQRGLRTGTCTALDHVELVSIDKKAFALLLEPQREIQCPYATTSAPPLRPLSAD